MLSEENGSGGLLFSFGDFKDTGVVTKHLCEFGDLFGEETAEDVLCITEFVVWAVDEDIFLG